MTISITPRLKTIAGLCAGYRTAADVGTDHGYLPVYLVKHGDFEKVIATDVKLDPLQKACRIINRFRLNDKIEVRQGNGLQVMEPGEAEIIIIAGMGGVLISDLLQAAPEVARKAEKLVLQPVQAAPELRDYLYQEGYHILTERIVQEKHRFYEIIVAEYKGTPPRELTLLERETGFHLRLQKQLTAQGFLQRKIRILEKKIMGMKAAEQPDIREIEAAIQLVKALKEELTWLSK